MWNALRGKETVNLISHSKTRRIWMWVCALAMGFAAASPAPTFAQSGLLSGSVGGSSGSTSMRLPRSRNTAGVAGCLGPGDCNDNVPCTADICIDGNCLNLSVPGCVPCELSYDCPPVDLVFIMDTSGSMRDEAAVLCAQVFSVSDELAAMGITASINSLGITELPGGPFDCLFDTVVGAFGDTVPGELHSCPFPDGSAAYETWGPATAIVAQNYPWTPGAVRIIVPMSDEGPCNGSRPEGCNDPGDDRESIDNAIAIALANNVIVSPIAGTGSDACVINLGSAIAKATGGHLHQFKSPKSEFRSSLIEIIHQTCVADDHCDDRELCTNNDSCVDGRCMGTPIEGCQVCADDFDCDDQNLCTSDVCVAGFCEWTPLHGEDECCNPTTGSLTPISDNNSCTTDVCNPDTGLVIHTPSPAGVSCDDHEACTIGDVCDASGKCDGTPVYTLPCETDADCFGNTCSTSKHVCVCNEIPELCLNDVAGALRGEGCYNVGEDVFINLEVGNNASLIAGGQFLIKYDPAALQFIDIMPGNSVDPESPFGTEISRTVDETQGSVFYAVGVVLGGPLTYGPSLMAVVHFKALSACSSTEVCFGDENPMNTRLTDSNGHTLAFTPCCTGEIRINGPAPALTCPQDITINAEAGTLSANVSWSPVKATPSCPLDDTQVTCTSTNSKNVNVDYLLLNGGRAPLGKSTFTCSATNTCGSQRTCDWDVDVRNFNTVEVDLQLSSLVTAGPLSRCIEFSFYSSCSEPPVVVQKTVGFGLPFNLAGRADRVQLNIPPGQYYCATARDNKHTLASRASMSIVGTKYYVKFAGDPVLGGNWLIGGNLDGNGVIDAVDQALVMAQYLQSINPQSPCGASGFHPDINGDGLVNVDDLAFVQRNFLKTDAAPCCPGNTASAFEAGMEEISLEELSGMGLGDFSAADINGDGVVNRIDMDLLIRQERSDAKSNSRRGGHRSR